MGLTGGHVMVVVSVFGLTYIWRRRIATVEDRRRQRRYAALGYGMYTEDEINRATDNKANRLGEGGFGEVYSGNINGTAIAVKGFFNLNLEEFENEMDAMAALHHNNVVRLLGYTQSPYSIVMPLAENRTLAHQLCRANPIPQMSRLRFRIDMALKIANGILHVHHMGIIHRDIKPLNVLLNRDFDPMISDFGLAVFLHNRPVGPAGTFGYMPEEDIDLTEKWDVYSFGSLLVDLIRGEKPYEPRDIENIRLRMESVCFRHMSYNSLIDSNLNAASFHSDNMGRFIYLALRCLNRDFNSRPTMQQVVNILEGQLRDIIVMGF